MKKLLLLWFYAPYIRSAKDLTFSGHHWKITTKKNTNLVEKLNFSYSRFSYSSLFGATMALVTSFKSLKEIVDNVLCRFKSDGCCFRLIIGLFCAYCFPLSGVHTSRSFGSQTNISHSNSIGSNLKIRVLLFNIGSQGSPGSGESGFPLPQSYILIFVVP